MACKATGNSPPNGFSWTSHSLRKGAASAANAIKAPLNDIRYSGGWFTNSNVLEAKYIDFAMAPSTAAYIFFGHLKLAKYCYASRVLMVRLGTLTQLSLRSRC